MTFQPLTKEQYKNARKEFSHTQIMEMEQQRKAQEQPQTQEAPEQGGPNIAQQIGQSAIGSTLVRPAVRTGQAIGAMGIRAFGSEEQKERLPSFLAEHEAGVTIPGLGEIEVPPVKAGTDGARQILGESLEAASWLYGPPKAVASVGVGLGRGMLQSGSFLAKHGAIAGGMYGAGEGLQDEEQDGLDVAASTAFGAGAGAIGGGVLGAAMPVAPIAMRGLGQAGGRIQQGIRGITEAGTKVAKAGGGALRSAAEGVGNVPLRMGDRAIEASQKMAQRQAQMRSATPHVREAMKQGVPEDWIKIATTGDQTDKVVRADMLEMAKAGTDINYTGPRPVARVGEQINEGPVKHLIGVKDKSVTRTNQILDSLPKEPQNISNVRQQFVDDMTLGGVRVKDGVLEALPGSRIPKSDLNFYQQIYDDIGPGELTYRQMHQLRQKYFDTAKSNDLFTDGTTSYARRMRSFLTKEIDEPVGGQYFESQTTTREAIEGLQEYAKLLGYKGNLKDLTSKNLKAGETFMRVFGTMSDKPHSSLQTLHNTANKYGFEGQSLDQTILQLRFAHMLDRVYGPPTRGIEGIIGRATSPTSDPTQTVASGVREMVKWSPYSGAIRLLRASGLMGKRPEDIMRTFENMIFTEAGRPMQTQAVSPIREAINSVTENLKRGGRDAVDNVMDGPQSFNQGGIPKQLPANKVITEFQLAGLDPKNFNSVDDFITAYKQKNTSAPIKQSLNTTNVNRLTDGSETTVKEVLSGNALSKYNNVGDVQIKIGTPEVVLPNGTTRTPRGVFTHDTNTGKSTIIVQPESKLGKSQFKKTILEEIDHAATYNSNPEFMQSSGYFKGGFSEKAYIQSPQEIAAKRNVTKRLMEERYTASELEDIWRQAN